MRTLLAALLGAGTLLGLASCTGTPEAQGEPAIGPIPTVASESTLPALPLDAYRVTGRQRSAVLDATRIVARRCMARYGFDWHGNDPTPQPDLDVVYRRRYGVLDADQVARYGYAVAPDAGPPPAKNAFNPSAGELAVWRGDAAPSGGAAIPAGGCQGEVNRTMEAGVPGTGADPDLQQRLAADSFTTSQNDSRVQAAIAGWSACMKRAGYDYRSVWDPSDTKWETPTSAREIATATADVTCKHEVNLAGIWVAVESGYQRRLIEKNAQRLDAVHKQVEAETRNAATVLSGG